MNIDQVLKLTISTLKASFPDALSNGAIEKVERVYNSSSMKNEEGAIDTQQVLIIPDTFTEEELQASQILKSDLKLYIIATDISDISYYDRVVFKGQTFKIFKLVDQLVGSKTALWTIVARK